MMRKFTTLLLSFALVAGVYAQDKPECTFANASTPPEIGGDIDAVWDEATTYYIETMYHNADPAPTLPGGASFRGMWDDAGIYLLVEVGDDVYYPWYAPDPDGANKWQYDKPEFYFDVNYTLEDGKGSTDGGANGHWQVAPDIVEGSADGTQLVEGDYTWALYDNGDGSYWAEYFIPKGTFKDEDGFAMDMTREVGFDAYIIDNDDVAAGSQQRMVWANDGTVDQAWANMDDCGIVIFDGASTGVYVETITISGDDIDQNNGMVQLQAEVLPAEANQEVLWTIDEVNSTGRAKISEDGMLTAVMDGDITIYAMAVDGSWVESNYLTISISNQIISRPEINMIRNGYFKDLSEDGAPLEWNEWGAGGTVDDGVYSVTPDTGTANIWDFRLQQQGPWGINADDDYTLSFRLWADDVDTMNVDFEDATPDAYLRYGTSSHELSNGRSDWTFMTETEPTKYVFDIQFVDWNEDRNEQFHFMMGHCDPTVYIDSVELFNDADLSLIDEYIEVTEITVSGETAVAVGGTAQMSAAILPADADYPTVKWSVVNGTGYATIDDTGMLTCDSAGVVTVVALAYDDSGVEGVLDVTIGSTGIGQKALDVLKVYPNPAVNELTVELTSDNSTVSIYNSVGQKMEQVVVSGRQYKFDISSYAAGIYFVKTETSIAKFIK